MAEQLNAKRWGTLSKELKVAVMVRKMRSRGDLPYFGSVFRALSESEEMSESTLHTVFDRLIDLGTIRAEWDRTKDGKKWVRAFSIKGEHERFIDKIISELYN